MAELIMCSNPECGELFDISDENVGREVKCPSCGSVQFVKSREEEKQKVIEDEKDDSLQTFPQEQGIEGTSQKGDSVDTSRDKITVTESGVSTSGGPAEPDKDEIDFIPKQEEINQLGPGSDQPSILKVLDQETSGEKPDEIFVHSACLLT